MREGDTLFHFISNLGLNRYLRFNALNSLEIFFSGCRKDTKYHLTPSLFDDHVQGDNFHRSIYCKFHS